MTWRKEISVENPRLSCFTAASADCRRDQPRYKGGMNGPVVRGTDPREDSLSTQQRRWSLGHFRRSLSERDMKTAFLPVALVLISAALCEKVRKKEGKAHGSVTSLCHKQHDACLSFGAQFH